MSSSAVGASSGAAAQPADARSGAELEVRPSRSPGSDPAPVPSPLLTRAGFPPGEQRPMSNPDEPICNHFDHTDPALVGQHLYDAYTQLRSRCPVARSDAHGGFWALSRYEDVIAAALNPGALISGRGITIPPLGNPVPAIPTESDGTAHKDYRGAIWPFLTPTAVRRYEQPMRDMITELIDSFIESGEADLVPALTNPIPVRAASLVFGFDAEEGRLFDKWFRALLEAVGDGDIEAQGEAASDFINFLRDSIRTSTPESRDGLLRAVLTGQHSDGRPFDEDEQVGLLWTTAAAAVETSSHALEHGFELLGKERESRDALIDDPSRIKSAVEEILRLSTPNNMIARTVAEPVEFGGTALPPGDRVLLLWGSANRDPDAFTNPDVYQPDREQTRHLAFGWGLHNCAGQHLARLEIRVALEEVLRRLPDYEISGDVPPSRIRGGLFWGLDSLPVRFTPGPKEGSPTGSRAHSDSLT